MRSSGEARQAGAARRGGGGMARSAEAAARAARGAAGTSRDVRRSTSLPPLCARAAARCWICMIDLGALIPCKIVVIALKTQSRHNERARGVRGQVKLAVKCSPLSRRAGGFARVAPRRHRVSQASGSGLPRAWRGSRVRACACVRVRACVCVCACARPFWPLPLGTSPPPPPAHFLHRPPSWHLKLNSCLPSACRRRAAHDPRLAAPTLTWRGLLRNEPPTVRDCTDTVTAAALQSYTAYTRPWFGGGSVVNSVNFANKGSSRTKPLATWLS
jgi:hypothetical protein